MSLVNHNIDAVMKRLVHAIDGTPADGMLIVETPAAALAAAREAADCAGGDMLERLKAKALMTTVTYIEHRLREVNETVAQLFLCGPTWDGNLASKSSRDAAVDLGFAYRHDGWQSLTERGLRYALAIDFKSWHDQRFYHKQNKV